MNIYVSNLSYNSTSEGLQELFAGHGEVSSANIITDRETGRSRGFGFFVEMQMMVIATKAIDELNNSDFEGKTITVNVARPRTERSSGGYNRGGNGGYNRKSLLIRTIFFDLQKRLQELFLVAFWVAYLFSQKHLIHFL